MSRRSSPRPTDLVSELPPISYVWETPNRRPRRAEWDVPDPVAPGRLASNACKARTHRAASTRGNGQDHRSHQERGASQVAPRIHHAEWRTQWGNRAGRHAGGAFRIERSAATLGG